MANEDFTTWAYETDPGADIGITASTVTWVNLETRAGPKSWFADDFSLGVGVDAVHEWEMQVVAWFGAAGAAIVFWELASELDDNTGIRDPWGLNVYVAQSGSTTLWLVGYEAGAIEGFDPYVMGGTEFDVFFQRLSIDADGGVPGKGQFTLQLYSDSGRTVLLDTLVIDAPVLTVADNASFIYACQTWTSDTTSRRSSGYTKDLNLDPSASVVPQAMFQKLHI